MKTRTTLIMSLTAILTLAAGSAFGSYSGGSGTAGDPYQIADANDLLALAANTANYSKCFILTADIDLQYRQVWTTAIIAADTDNSNEDFDGTAFTGTFDGNGHKIIHFTINGGSNWYLGLFGYINSGSVKNLGLENCSVRGYYYVGGLVGYNMNDGNVSNCYSTGSVSGVSGSEYVGGLVGSNYGGNVSNCYSTGTVSGGDGSYGLGGLVGVNDGSINDCYSTGDVTGGDGSYGLGGLVGGNDCDISNCYSTGTVSGYMYVGGLVGENIYGIISNCYSTGVVGGSDNVGGLLGYNDGDISNCYSTGVVGGSDNVGGLLGYNDGSISGSYFLTTSGPNNGFRDAVNG